MLIFVLALTVLLTACGRKGPDAPPDKTPPAIVATTPSDLAPNVAPNAAISITFSEPVDAGTISFKLVSILDGAPVPCTMSYSGTTAVYTPDHDLAYYTSYNAWVGAGVKDLAGNPMTYDTSWSFTTSQAPDTTPPRVVDIQPSKRKTGVSPSTVIAIMFSEPMDPSTIKSATIKLSTVAGDIPGTISYNGAIAAAIFIPDNSLFSNTYIVTVTTGVKDLAKNAMTDAFVSSFKTSTTKDTTRPSVSSIFPAFGATAGVNTPISITFSEPMNVSTITPTNITVSDGNATIPGELKYYETTAVFTPSNPLQYPSSYTVNIAKEVTDLSGNGMSADYSWTFTMESNAPDTVQPYVLSPSPFPANNQSKVPVYKQIVALFSEKMLASSITPATFTFVDQDGASVQGHFAAGGATAVFVPAQPLAYSKTYTATITSGPTDITGNALQSNSPGGYTWSFTTEAVASFTITATASAKGSISPSGAVPVNYGLSQTFAITPNAHYHIVDVLVDGSSVDPVTSYTFTNVTDDHTISASFAIDTFTITATVGENGSISPSGAISVDYGANQTFTITPAAGYHISDVLVDGIWAGPVTTYSFTNVTGNHTISASFAINAYTVMPSAGANGIISPNTAQPVNHNATTTFTVTPAAGYSAIMSGTCGGALIGNTYTTNPITGDCTVIASFATNIYDLTVTKNGTGAGNVTADPGTLVWNGNTGIATYNYGTPVTLTATPDASSTFAGWSGGVCTGTLPCTVTIDAAKSVTATFTIKTFTIEPSADSTGSINPSTPQTVNYGANQTFTFTPSNGYHISSVTVDGVDQGLLSSYTFNTVMANHTIVVSFALDTRTITATAGIGGTIAALGFIVQPGTSSNFLVDYGNNRTFTITASTGYHIADVLVDNFSIGAATSYTFTNITTNHTIEARFSPILTVTKSGTGSGTVTGAGTYVYNTNVQVTATADLGSTFTGWSGACAGTVSPTTVLMDGPKTCMATFMLNPTLAITKTGTGSGTVTGAGTYVYNTNVQVTATADPGSIFAGWSGACAGTVSPTTVLMDGDKTCTATFTINIYTIEVTNTDPNGTVNCTPTSVNYGSSSSCLITPNTGFNVLDVLVDGGSIGAVSTYTFTNVTADHTISASFTAEPPQ